MKYYIILTSVQAERMRKESQAESKLPQSDLSLLARNLEATFITPESYAIELQPIDIIRAKLSATPENWAFARAISPQFTAEDVVFCPGEEIGIPLVNICRSIKERPKIIVWFHRITGLRSRIALKLFKIGRVDYAVVCSRLNQSFLKNYLNLKEAQIFFWWYPINVTYFAAKSKASDDKPQPLIVSCGLEQRDYRLLAAATKDLDVDVKVAGFSQFQSVIAKTFPKVMPENMSNRRYSIPELTKLYGDADVVAVCLKQNNGTSGVTVLTEAMACRKAIVCTRTKGLKDYLDDEEAIMTIEPGDVAGFKKAILNLLNHPEAASRADRAYELVKRRHKLETQVETLTKFIKTIK